MAFNELAKKFCFLLKKIFFGEKKNRICQKVRKNEDE